MCDAIVPVLWPSRLIPIDTREEWTRIGYLIWGRRPDSPSPHRNRACPLGRGSGVPRPGGCLPLLVGVNWLNQPDGSKGTGPIAFDVNPPVGLQRMPTNQDVLIFLVARNDHHCTVSGYNAFNIDLEWIEYELKCVGLVLTDPTLVEIQIEEIIASHI